MSGDVLAALMGRASGPLSRHPRMSEQDHHALQLLLTFLRNLSGGTPASASSVQEQLLLALHEELALELVLLVACHADEWPFRADAPLLLDLLAEVYAGDRADLLDLLAKFYAVVDVADVLAATEEAAAAAAAAVC
ncbi:hypothetical protein COO60DRAFT_1644220 [Scenedesmus sp. NREL 46B-D3]|nr:hypothetical protein COO60DRAFT_1644220 [Scenedesmus sp. NREL 46B-D3]